MEEGNTGVVKGLIYGIGGLLIVTIVTLIIVSTMIDSNLLRATEGATITVNNETGTVTSTPYTLANFDSRNRNYAISYIMNGSAVTTNIVPANYTFNSATGVLTNKTAHSYAVVNITYTYTLTTEYENSVDNLGGNLTKGISNVSSKLPTILLIGAVILLFGVILLLVRYSQSMGFGGQGGSL